MLGAGDGGGVAAPGFACSDADPIQSSGSDLQAVSNDQAPGVIDTCGAQVSWRGRADLSALHGSAVQLTFHFTRTRLFAFQLHEGRAPPA